MLDVKSLDPLYQATQEALLQHQRIPWAHSWVVLVALQSQFDGQIQQVERTQGLPPFASIKVTRIISKYAQPGGNATDKCMI